MGVVAVCSLCSLIILYIEATSQDDTRIYTSANHKAWDCFCLYPPLLTGMCIRVIKFSTRKSLSSKPNQHGGMFLKKIAVYISRFMKWVTLWDNLRMETHMHSTNRLYDHVIWQSYLLRWGSFQQNCGTGTTVKNTSWGQIYIYTNNPPW